MNIEAEKIRRVVVEVAVLIAAGFGAWFAFDNFPFSSEIVVYNAWCPTEELCALP